MDRKYSLLIHIVNHKPLVDQLIPPRLAVHDPVHVGLAHQVKFHTLATTALLGFASSEEVRHVAAFEDADLVACLEVGGAEAEVALRGGEEGAVRGIVAAGEFEVPRASGHGLSERFAGWPGFDGVAGAAVFKFSFRGGPGVQGSYAPVCGCIGLSLEVGGRRQTLDWFHSDGPL
jgi:hypothetical protein